MKRIWICLAILSILAAWTESQEGATSVPTAADDCDCGDEPPGFFPSPAEPALQERAVRGDDKTQMDLFVMSLCPYGMEAERVLLPLVERFADQVELNIHYIANPAADRADSASARRPPPRPRPRRSGCAATAASGQGPFRSLHGQEEIDESRRQLVILINHPERHRRYVLCRSRKGPDGDWRSCARAAGMDVDSLQARALGPRGERLFRENIRLANALRIDLSPTLLIDGEEFVGDFDRFSLARRICRQRPGDARCQQVPACGSDADCGAPPGQLGLCEDPDTPRARCVHYQPVVFTLKVLSTAACDLCDTGTFLRTTAELFPGGHVETYTLETPAGAALAQKYGIQVFPAYIFSAEFARSPRFPRVRHMVVSADDGYLLQPRIASSTFWRRRPPRPGRLDLFLPAWSLGLENEFLRLWPGDSSPLRVLHLLDGNAPDRVPEELVRRACLTDQQGPRYPVYAMTRNQALQARQRPDDWERAARIADVDLDALQRCVDSGRGRQLLAAAQALADSLDLDPGSAAALLENRILIRRAQARQIADIWPEGKTP